MTENWFGDEVAATYDDESDPMFAPALLEATAAFLAGLAGAGRALELAVGTGRVALPLSARGVPVSGIELSPHMLERLRAKPGGGAIDVVEGDLTSARVPGEFSLVYLVYNTITNLTTQDAQVATFENAARHLAPGGRFVIEVYVPILRLLPPGERFHVFADEPTYHAYDEYADASSQLQWSHHVRLRAGRDLPTRLHALPLRVAGRAGPDGQDRRAEAHRAVAGLGPDALHRGQHPACLGMGEAVAEHAESAEMRRRRRARSARRGVEDPPGRHLPTRRTDAGVGGRGRADDQRPRRNQRRLGFSPGWSRLRSTAEAAFRSTDAAACCA